jgi:hypothetical protein
MANLRVDKITSTETFDKTGSVQFGNDNALKLSANSDFDLTSNDFTMEAWVYLMSVESFQTLLMYTVDGTEDDTSFQFDITSTQLRFVGYVSNSSVVTGSNFSFESGTWYHVAATRTNDLIRLFVDGNLIGTHGFTSTIDTEGSAELNIGYRNNNGTMDREVFGHLTNIRIVKGTALYTSNFKTSMRELEVVPDTVLLCCQSKTDASLEKTGKTITVLGSASANELTPGILTPVVKSGGGSAITGSVEFGENDYLTLTPSTDFNFGTGDFTIEFWIHPQKRFTSYPTIFEITDSDHAKKLYINFRNGANLALTDATTVFAQNGLFNLDDWFHVAVVRTSGQSRLYMNGVGGSSVSCTRDFGGSNNGIVYIGRDHTGGSTEKYNGFISNLRIIKGTALYTDNFIPPTRELKRVPGTVLLCCQDSDNPLTEATGKTITGYGDLRRTDGSELVTNGDFSNGTTGWTISDSGEGSMAVVSGQLVVTNNDTSDPPVYAWQQITTAAGNRYRVKFQLVGGTASSTAIYLNSASSLGDAYGQRATSGTNPLAVGAVGELEFVAAGTSAYILLRVNANESATSIFDNISAYAIPHDADAPASNFTPQVGDDRKVTFEGVTKIDTDAYFYLPTGDTESRTLNVATQASSSARGVFMGGLSSAPSGSVQDVMDYVTVTSTGNAADFGNLTAATRISSSCSSTTRGVRMGGFSDPATVDVIDYITIASTGNSQDFGDLSLDRHSIGGAANSVRGINFGDNSRRNLIEYITIPTTGDSKDFGDMVDGLGQVTGTASPTRCVMAGGEAPTRLNTMQYVTIMSMGNAFDFGDLTIARSGVVSLSSATRGLYLGGELPASPSFTNTVDFVQIATTGNAINFGDLDNSTGMRLGATAASPTRGLYAGGGNDQPVSNTAFTKIHLFTIASTGNATDFGDITVARFQMNNGTVSSGHGGLG